MLSLPLITPRDVSGHYCQWARLAIDNDQAHELWFGPSQPYRSSASTQQQHQHPHHAQSSETTRRQNHRGSNNSNNGRSSLFAATTTSDSLAALQLEERALRVRKANIASFGYAWLKPAGCPKTMLGMKEEEAEREEAMAAAAAEMQMAAAATTTPGAGQDMAEIEEGMERDLDDDIPEADEVEGLVEEGEEGFEEDDEGEMMMERNLDDDIPDAFPDYDDDEDEEEEEEEADFDNQPDLDDEIPAAEDDGFMDRDLDDDVPEAGSGEEEEEEEEAEEEEWQHTDTEDELDDDADNTANDPFAEHLRNARTPGSAGRGAHRDHQQQQQYSHGVPPSVRRRHETSAQRRFLARWSAGRDSLGVGDVSEMSLGDELDIDDVDVDVDDLRASITSQDSLRQSRGRLFPQRFPRRGARDSLG